MKNLLLLMLIPLIGIAQSPSSLAIKGSITANAEDKILLKKNNKSLNLLKRICVCFKKYTF